jgi:hypothetical protein
VPDALDVMYIMITEAIGRFGTDRETNEKIAAYVIRFPIDVVVAFMHLCRSVGTRTGKPPAFYATTAYRRWASSNQSTTIEVTRLIQQAG